MTTIANRLQDILATIQSTKSTNHCKQHVSLLAVSKAQSSQAIREAFFAGQKIFGENYLQEAIEKQSQLTDLNIEWHFIGPIQSNKTQLIAQNFSWVHSVDRLKIAQRLNDARPENLAPLQVCIQVNSSNEVSKSGVAPKELESLAIAIALMPRLKLRGLMSIPEPSNDNNKQRAQFKQVRECYDALIAKGFALDTLSIGMSDDYTIAIEQGATIVRIGSALFGARKYAASK
ncbi:YggS family pyridoxal phosphate-dependent enzyme [Methylotenera sp.]|uniref:YggS family pyridoxal phosphate-dependent enzyme n=1 Tax=Methylotenera sp. TaxID=2051956 RepID=UPI002724BA7B|nr:YggS family pyridoxal phosphate-dependent enzyme [Methylotenera sp.]MDO9205182.1 YggS family pyridoxal phosphate-dependent enzyme [Methylotenera sp.]MDO9393569.1 YggS family pyridoxal phosphate-dependent enzyme [Methylotenera sp.]MDP1523995.1 YggS family pyridoxal phosphate-dependent enzyme [Methylotenera sp.]MDP2070398.1 YggS family pyridoxal phosphate-dependent enzyme [Methylotenera sp.]MDP2230493.1 YggS family pyridoxal phosphate-dependent enzyme [Methylotenera sp.]